jgi:hypothetical protein
MFQGKSVVKTKIDKLAKKQFKKQENTRLSDKPRMKHQDKALWRSMKQSEKEDFGGFEVDNGY